MEPKHNPQRSRPPRKFWTPPVMSGHRASPELAKACRAQIVARFEGKSPREVIALIEPRYEQASAHGQTELKAHIADLYAFGDDWPLMHDEARDCWIMPDGRSVPMSQPAYGGCPPGGASSG